MKVTSELAEIIKKICENEKLIIDVNYEGKKYWEMAKKHRFAFVDGGAYSSFLSSSAPFAIRANTYIVKPDELLEKRELFNFSILSDPIGRVTKAHILYTRRKPRVIKILDFNSLMLNIFRIV